MAKSDSSTPEIEKKALENGVQIENEDNANMTSNEQEPCLPYGKQQQEIVGKEKKDSADMCGSDSADFKQLDSEVNKNNKNSYKLTAGKKRKRFAAAAKLSSPPTSAFEKRLQEKTGLSRLGLIVGGLLLLLLLILLITILLMIVFWPRTPHSQLFPICKRAACLRASAEILPKIDANGTACEDFRNFACGKWLARNAVPKDRSSWNLKQQLQRSHRDRIRQLITTMPHPERANTLSWKLKYFYDSCMALDNIETDGGRPLNRIITELGSWGVLRDFSVHSWEWKRTMEQLHSQHGVSVFIEVSVVPDAMDAQLDIIKISPAPLGLPDRSYYYRPHDCPAVEAYKRYLKDVAQTMGATSTDAVNFSEDMFSYEKRLAEVMPDVRKSEPFSTYNKRTVGELKDLAPSIPLHEILLAKYPQANIEDKTEVIVTYPDYIRNISNIISTTDRSALNNYMMWRLAESYLPYLSKQYTDTVSMYRKAMYGECEPVQRWEFCIETMQRFMGFGLAVLVENGSRNTDQSVRIVDEMFEDVRSAVKTSIRQASWFEQDLENHLFDKINGLALQVGFPSTMLREQYVTDFYRTFLIQKNDFFQNIRYGINFLQAHEQRRLNLPSEEHRWMDMMSKPELKVSYVVEVNKVIVPQALLVEPYFHPEYPPAVLFGGLGVEMSSAVLKSIVPWDILYAGDGTLLVNQHPAVNQSARAFRHPVFCLRRWWNKEGLIEPELNETVYRHIAAISGVRQAFKALEKHLSLYPHIHQPALETYENQNIFFITYAQAICSLKTEQQKEMDLDLETYLDDTSLLATVLSQLKEFTNTFGCSSSDLLYTEIPCDDIL